MSENIQKVQLKSIEKKTNILSLILAIAILAIGVALFFFSGSFDNNILSSTIIFIGVIAIAFSLYIFIAKTKINVYTKTGSLIVKKNIFFDTSDFYALKSALENNDFQPIKKAKKIDEGNIQIYALYSKDNKFAAVQLLKYEPFDFIPQTNIIVMENEKAEDFIKSIAA